MYIYIDGYTSANMHYFVFCIFLCMHTFVYLSMHDLYVLFDVCVVFFESYICFFVRCTCSCASMLCLCAFSILNVDNENPKDADIG